MDNPAPPPTPTPTASSTIQIASQNPFLTTPYDWLVLSFVSSVWALSLYFINLHLQEFRFMNCGFGFCSREKKEVSVHAKLLYKHNCFLLPTVGSCSGCLSSLKWDRIPSSVAQSSPKHPFITLSNTPSFERGYWILSLLNSILTHPGIPCASQTIEPPWVCRAELCGKALESDVPQFESQFCQLQVMGSRLTY